MIYELVRHLLLERVGPNTAPLELVGLLRPYIDGSAAIGRRLSLISIIAHPA
jgi:hypothetical protein